MSEFHSGCQDLHNHQVLHTHIFRVRSRGNTLLTIIHYMHPTHVGTLLTSISQKGKRRPREETHFFCSRLSWDLNQGLSDEKAILFPLC